LLRTRRERQKRCRSRYSIDEIASSHSRPASGQRNNTADYSRDLTMAE
jgi:hypothetical protein